MSEMNYAADDPRLVESEQRYRAVIENASDMIQSVRADGTFEFVNKAWMDTLGYSAEDVETLSVWDIIHPESIDHCQPIFAKAVGGEPIGFMTTVFVAKDGRAVPVEGNVTSRFVGDTVVATHGFFRDVTEQLRARELEERNRELEREQQARYLEKMAALGKLSAGLAHELNNPAAAIQRANSGLAESLKSRDSALRGLINAGLQSDHWQAIDTILERIQSADPSENTLGPLEISEQEEIVEEWLEAHDVARGWDVAPGLVKAGITSDQLEALAQHIPNDALMGVVAWLTETLSIHESTRIIERSSHRISELVNAVKGYTHMDRATEQTVDVHDGLENTLVILGHRLRDVNVRRDYQRDLPPVHAFGNTLNQVWTNIIDNAIDATGGKGTISIRTRRDDNGHVVVEIEDNGAGIAKDDLACIFEPFFTTKPQGQGTGLGLDTAYRIVTDEHRGSISAESEPGRTVFRVSIPITSMA